MKGHQSLNMAESSAYRCFTRCFSSCLGLKDAQNESTVNGEFYQNGFAPIDDKNINHVSEKQGDGLNSFKQHAKSLGGKGCCALAGAHDEMTYTYEPMSREEGDKLSSPIIMNGLVTSHKETSNGSMYVTTLQPASQTKGDTVKTRTSIENQSSVTCNTTRNSSQNGQLRHSQKQHTDNKLSNSFSLNGKASDFVTYSVNENDTHSHNTSPNLIPLNSPDDKQTLISQENQSIPHVNQPQNTFSPNMKSDHSLISSDHTHNNNENRKNVIKDVEEQTNIGREHSMVKSVSSYDCKTVDISSEAIMKLDNIIPLKDNLLDLDMQCTATTKQEKVTKNEKGHEEGDTGIAHFRNLIETEKKKLTDLIHLWEKVILDRVKEEVQDEIRSVVGQTRLVISERFTQFGSLVDQSEKYHHLPEEDRTELKVVTLTDLQGFWDMIYFQVEDVLTKFGRLEKARDNDWNFQALHDESKKAQKRTAKPVTTRKTNTPKKTTGPSKVVSEEEKARRLAAKKRLMEARKRMAEQKRTNQNDNIAITISM